MCGIAGFVGDFKAPHKSVEIMLSSLEHRGPDDQQIFLDNLFCGGMRRLSINDLEGGAQPLFNKDKSLVTFYNGEIYNYHKLRNFLEGKKFSFNTSSDGEVIPFLWNRRFFLLRWNVCHIYMGQKDKSANLGKRFSWRKTFILFKK